MAFHHSSGTAGVNPVSTWSKDGAEPVPGQSRHAVKHVAPAGRSLTPLQPVPGRVPPSVSSVAQASLHMSSASFVVEAKTHGKDRIAKCGLWQTWLSSLCAPGQ